MKFVLPRIQIGFGSYSPRRSFVRIDRHTLDTENVYARIFPRFACNRRFPSPQAAAAEQSERRRLLLDRGRRFLALRNSVVFFSRPLRLLYRPRVHDVRVRARVRGVYEQYNIICYCVLCRARTNETGSLLFWNTVQEGWRDDDNNNVVRPPHPVRRAIFGPCRARRNRLRRGAAESARRGLRHRVQ